MNRLGLNSKISVDIGFGVRPLFNQSNNNIHSILMSGMGPLSVLQIIADDENANFMEDEIARRKHLSFTALDALGVKQVIMQPWPPNCIAVHSLSREMLARGWTYEDQRIVKYAGYHHITTSFVRNNEQMETCVLGAVPSDLWIAEKAPLAVKYNRGLLSPTEARVWQDYLSNSWSR